MQFLQFLDRLYDKTLQRRREFVPTCDPEGVNSVKPFIPDNAKRPKYSGQSIIDCWKLLTTL